MLLHSISKDFDLKVSVEPKEPDVSVPAEDCRDGDMPGRLEAFLEIQVGSRWFCHARSVPRMTMEVRQEPVAELLEPDEQLVADSLVRGHTEHVSTVVLKVQTLIEHHHT